MSKAALCATSTVSSQKRWKAGSTSAMVGWPRSAAGSIRCTRADAGLSGRPGSTSCSNTSLRSSRPLTTRTAPMLMISSPAEGSRPVVSVSNTV